MINVHNLERSLGLHTYSLAMNHLGDMVRRGFRCVQPSTAGENIRSDQSASPHLQTADELRDTLMGTIVPSELHRITINISTQVAKPFQVSLDWRTFGMVSEVKSQVRSDDSGGEK